MAGSHKGIWKKRVLLPLWIIQLLALVVFLGVTALGVWVWDRVKDDADVEDAIQEEYPELSSGELDKAVDINAGVNFAFSILTILIVFVEMVLFCTHRLAPMANLVMQSIKSLIWGGYMVWVIVEAVRSGGNAGGIFLVLVIFLTSIGLLAYGATIFHRSRKGTLHRGNYAAASTGGPTSYEPNRYSQTTGYAGAPAPNPFRDPSPAPPYNPHAMHPANRPAGEAGEYYGGGGSYEMQHGVK